MGEKEGEKDMLWSGRDGRKGCCGRVNGGWEEWMIR